MQEFIDFETELLEARWIVVQTNDIVHIALPIKWSWMGATCKELIEFIHVNHRSAQRNRLQHNLA